MALTRHAVDQDPEAQTNGFPEDIRSDQRFIEDTRKGLNPTDEQFHDHTIDYKKIARDFLTDLEIKQVEQVRVNIANSILPDTSPASATIAAVTDAVFSPKEIGTKIETLGLNHINEIEEILSSIDDIDFSKGFTRQAESQNDAAIMAQEARSALKESSPETLLLVAEKLGAIETEQLQVS